MLTQLNNKLLAAADGYTLLEPSVAYPTTNTYPEGTTNLTTYLQGAYITMFVVVIIAAIVTLVYFGLGYMLSDTYNFKSDAKQRMTKVFIGIGIALLSYILLKEINPDLLNIDLTRIGQLNPF